MLHQYTINDVNNQPAILKFWLTKPIDTKANTTNTNTTNTTNTPKPSIIKNNTISRPKM